MTCSLVAVSASAKVEDSDVQSANVPHALDKVCETRRVKDMVTSMSVAKERITHEAGNDEAWVCICRNRPDSHGFYPCNANGDEVEPTPEDWTTGLYVCAQCGRIIHMDTLEVMGQNRDCKLLS